MSLRQLVEGDCGGVNPLMQLGGQLTRDAGHKDEGFMQAQFDRSMRQEEHMVNEFLGQVAGPPQSFQMETLLQEMREIEQSQIVSAQLQYAPKVSDEIADQWYEQFQNSVVQPPNTLQEKQGRHQSISNNFANISTYPPPYLAICPPHPNLPIEQQPQTALTNQFFDQMFEDESWANDYQIHNKNNEQVAANYNEKFWQRLQDEWAKLSEESDHPWLSEYDENFNPYKEYKFAEENPMTDIDNAFEKGKEYLSMGDIPSAVLCFEAAVSKEPENAEAWELLGISQAENEMDPQGIAALNKSLGLKPNNLKVLMALAVCYTNESLQSQAVKMLINWLQIHPKYKHLAHSNTENTSDTAGAMASSLIRGNKLQQTQNMFLEAVRMDPKTIDSELQEALGVLYNLSSEYDKAVDCFQAALHANPRNAKVWNRLGASLANGSRSVEAVEAYQRALELEPGFIRVRYNVGVCCLNLKAYKEAVEHLLTALSMQANVAANREMPTVSVGFGQKQMSESIWNTLKMVISLMGRNDLQNFVSERNLTALNEAFFKD